MNTTEVPAPIYVERYVRNKKEIEAAKATIQRSDNSSALVAASMSLMIALALLILLWYVILPAAAVTGAAYAYKRYTAAKSETPEKLPVNFYGRRTQWL